MILAPAHSCISMEYKLNLNGQPKFKRIELELQ